jgi:hypothetical protein
MRDCHGVCLQVSDMRAARQHVPVSPGSKEGTTVFQSESSVLPHPEGCASHVHVALLEARLRAVEAALLDLSSIPARQESAQKELKQVQ